MHWFRFAALILVATVLQASLVETIAVTNLNIKPDLLLILMVFFAIYSDTTEAIIASFVIGLAADIISLAMGPNIISFTVTGTLLAYLHRVITVRKMPHQVAAIFIAGCLTGGLACFLNFLKGQLTVSNIYAVVLGTCVYSAIIGPFFFLPCSWWMHIKTNRFKRQ